MKQYYKVIVKVENETEDSKGRPKTKVVREEYLIGAVSPTDADAKMNKHLEGLMGEFEVISIVQTRILEVIE